MDNAQTEQPPTTGEDKPIVATELIAQLPATVPAATDAQVATSLLDEASKVNAPAESVASATIPPLPAETVQTETESQPLPLPQETIEPLVTCNCGKRPGQGGPHAKACPVRGKSNIRVEDGKIVAGGKPVANSAGTSTTTSQVKIVRDDNPEVATPDYTQLAGLTFDMSVSSLQVIFGDEWKPENAEERNAVVGAVAKYMQAKGVQDIPPGVLVAFVVAAYAGKRVTHPNTKTKLINAYVKIKPYFARAWDWLTGFFRKKSPNAVIAPAKS